MLLSWYENASFKFNKNIFYILRLTSKKELFLRGQKQQTENQTMNKNLGRKEVMLLCILGS